MGNEDEEGRLTTISCRGAAVAMDLQLLYGDSPSPLRLTTIRRSDAARHGGERPKLSPRNPSLGFLLGYDLVVPRDRERGGRRFRGGGRQPAGQGVAGVGRDIAGGGGR
jgi:hypothetical protein